jgi:hypothetical protein
MDFARRTGDAAVSRGQILSSIFLVIATICSHAQTTLYEREFPQSKAALEKALRNIQGSLSGRLPVLEGFAQPGEHPLGQYQRGYYQATVEIRSTAYGGSIARVATKVTAWYSDPAASHSGYQLLASNGRIEADLLDQLTEQVASISSPILNGAVSANAAKPVPATTPLVQQTVQPPVRSQIATAQPTKPESDVPTPSPAFPDTNSTFSSSLGHGLANASETPNRGAEKTESALQTEADNLESVLKSTAHPNNLVAVKKSGTPVVSTPSLNAKPDFLASAHDEFELIDFNADWVHVRISGLSRGWIWRNSVEMPEGIPDTAEHAAASLTPAADLFHVMREEVAQFPGDWEPLRSKNVKIISVQQADENAKDAGPKERLEYAKFLMEKNFTEISRKPQELQGIVVIFDSIDGGMIAATATALQQWKAGALSDAALWHKCFFDPPETFDSAAASGSK